MDQIMKNKVTLKQNMGNHHSGAKRTYNFEGQVTNQNMGTHLSGAKRTYNFEGQVKSSAELLKFMKIKREEPIGGTKAPFGRIVAHNVEVQGKKQHVASSNVGGAKASKCPWVKVQGTNVQQTKQTKNVEGTKATIVEVQGQSSKPNKPLIDVAGSKISTEVEGPNRMQTKRTNFPSFSLAARSLEKKSQFATSDESRTKVPTEATKTQNKGCSQIQDRKRHLMKKAVTSEVNDSQPKHQSPKQPMKNATYHNESMEEQQGPKKIKKVPMCPAMLIDDFLKENGEQVEEEDEEFEIEDEEQDANEREGENAIEEEGSDINGSSKKRTRGPTRCLNVHARELEEREEVTLDDDGEPVGPNDKVVSDLSYFLGTIARNATYCPLIYTNFKALTKDERDAIWNYVNDKFIVPPKGKKAVFARVNDAWRRYKNYIKRKYFLKYPNMRERLKHRPKRIPEPTFKKLMVYWGNNYVQDISRKNAENRAKQKYIHRMGPTNFARIYAQLRAKKEDGSDVTQAEMFIETRTSRKGKEVDQDTQNVITKLHDSLQDSTECAGEAFHSVFGKEKPGRVRCFGRMVTPTVLKRNEEIAAIKRQYSSETTRMSKQLNGLQGLVKLLLRQSNPDLDEEALDNIMENAMDVENNASTSMDMQNVEKEIHQTSREEDQPEDQEDGCY